MWEVDVSLGVGHDSVMMRPPKAAHIKLTDFQIHGLAGLLSFSKDLKYLTKAELPDAFLVALDAHCEGEMPDHVWKIGRTRTVNDSMAELRTRVAEVVESMEVDSTPSSSQKKQYLAGPSAPPKHPKGSPEVIFKQPCRSF